MTAGKQLELVFSGPPRPKPNQLLEPDELFQLSDASLLTLIAEDRRLERKPASVNARELGDYIVMWANTEPYGGIIAVGIEDDGTVSGCSRVGQKHVNDVEKAGYIYSSEARVRSRRLPVVNSSGEDDYILLVLVQFSEDRLIRNSKGEAFWRVGDSKIKLTDEQAREAEIDRGQVDLEQELVNLRYPDDFDRSAIADFAQAIRVSRGLAESHTDEEMLKLRHLGRIDDGLFRPNKACVLLFALDPRSVFPGCRLRITRYSGDTEGTGQRLTEIKDIWLEGTVPAIIANSELAIDSQLRDFSRLGPDGRFYTAPEYPKDAWYEAIVNAVAHRSYSLKTRYVHVKIFDDRLEVSSPGGFPPLVTAENIYDSQHSRNHFLMDALFYLKFVKMANEGVRRMRDEMQDAGLPAPEFAEVSSTLATVRVVLRNNIKQRKVWLDADASHLIGEVIFARLDQAEKRIVNFVAEHHRINISQTQRLINTKTWHAARAKLRGLVKLGILKHVTSGKQDPKAHFALVNGGHG